MGFNADAPGLGADAGAEASLALAQSHAELVGLHRTEELRHFGIIGVEAPMHRQGAQAGGRAVQAQRQRAGHGQLPRGPHRAIRPSTLVGGGAGPGRGR